MVLAGFGGAYFFLAAILFLQQNSLVRIGISTTAIVLSATAAMMPTYLVGMCGSPAMPCRTGTYPAVLIVLAFLASAGVFNIFYLRERRGDEAPYNLAHSGNQS